MGNPLLVFWYRLFGPGAAPSAEDRDQAGTSTEQATATVFLVLRRMRPPLIVLVLIFAVSVLGLMLIPGRDAAGNPAPLGLLHAFYVMAYTATTIGFGELPHPFTDAQRVWVTLCIFLSVIGWAYAIGSLLALLQDRSFRRAVALQRFARSVRRLREPFWLMAGQGQTGRLLGDSLDVLRQRFVVVDTSETRIAELDTRSYHSDVPGLVGDPRNPGHLLAAGLEHPRCAGVLALAEDDRTNLAVTVTAALLRPGLPVVARTLSRRVAERMAAFAGPTVINPFDVFGEQLRLALQAPAGYQLIRWLTALPGEPMPVRGHQVRPGRWVLYGYGRFGQELTADLRGAGLEVTVVDQGTTTSTDPSVIRTDEPEDQVMERAEVRDAVGLIAATDDDVTNLALVAAARRANPHLFLVARQNTRASEPLFAALDADLVVVPAEVVAHEVLAHLGSPVLLHFLKEVPRRDEAWAEDVVGRLEARCGRVPLMTWEVALTAERAGALQPWLGTGEARLGDLLRSSDDRERPIAAVPLVVVRGEERLVTPPDDLVLAPGDALLLAGLPGARQDLENVLVDEATREYVVHGREVPSGWLWRTLAKERAGAREG
ncbi:NAD-binding protein [Georgenia thermotolerans]|uniref:Potassium transporter TrkA n=1 Tax=Georgenia thermotolerans TaxID=527326 RepID=A0A7J5UKR8_9MICO|nr:NAD-binding protein [Georgenia thermotolerans]KAE8762926.1 potassium transporter TrkA [Georgenia thermotolerans]